MWPFKKRKPESPEEKQALASLDEVTREVGWDELTKEAAREAPFGPLQPLGVEGVIQAPLHGDPDPAGGPTMHDVMHGAHVEEPEPEPDAAPEPDAEPEKT